MTYGAGEPLNFSLFLVLTIHILKIEAQLEIKFTDVREDRAWFSLISIDLMSHEALNPGRLPM